MKIGFFLDVFATGGSERVVQVLAGYLQQKGHDVSIVVLSRVNNEYSVPLGVKLITLPYSRNIDFVVQDLEALNFDIYSLHFHWMQYCFEIAEKLIGRGRKVVLSEHSMFFYMYKMKSTKAFLSKRFEVWQRASALTVLNSYDYQIYTSVLDNVALMPNPNTFSGLILPKEINKNLIAIARLTHAKALHRLLLVFKIVIQKYPDWHLLIVGDGELRKSLEQQAIDLSIQQHISFTGDVKNVQDYYAKSSIHVMTSVQEGFGLVITEAKKYSIPSVVMDLPCFHDLIAQEENGFIVPQGDVQAMADKIAYLIANPDILNKMGENAKHSASCYDVEIIGKRWEHLFDLVLNNPQTQVLEKLQANYAPSKTNTKKIIADFVKEYDNLYQQQISTFRKFILHKRERGLWYALKSVWILLQKKQ